MLDSQQIGGDWNVDGEGLVMLKVMSTHFWVLFAVLGLLVPSAVAALDPLDYQPRGNRSEGQDDEQVAGEFIKLIGAMVDTGGFPSTESWTDAQALDEWDSAPPTLEEIPETVSIHFWLGPGEKTAFPRVREYHRETYYLLDKVIQEWHPSQINQFAWPGKDVLQPLKLPLSQLVVLVRLDGEKPTGHEHVAPAVFWPQEIPQKVDKYRFYFQLLNESLISWKLYRAGSSVTLDDREKEEEYGVFHVEWDAAGHPDGVYELRLKGNFLTDNKLFEQVVTFRHRADWNVKEPTGTCH